MSNTYKDLQNSHPCFGGRKNNVGRIHLPVSPGCNIACRFCDRVINDALKVIDADLYVVLTGCIPEIVGDDTAEVVSHFEDSEKPVIYASTAGFKGNNYKGHEQIIDAIIDQYLEKADEKEKGLVNIWADVPYQDLFWLGNIRELEKLIAELGLTPNTIFGYQRGIKNIDRIPKAEFNLLVSPWVSVGNMKKMEKKLGIPYLHYPTLPIGAYETSKFLREVGKFAGVDEQKVESIPTTHVLDGKRPTMGYDGLLFLGNKIADQLQNPGFNVKLAQHVKLPYKDSWYQENAFKYIKGGN